MQSNSLVMQIFRHNGVEEILHPSDEQIASTINNASTASASASKTEPLTGMELTVPSGASLSIAVGLDSLALIVSRVDPDFVQHASLSLAEIATTDTVEVRWGEVTSIPVRWFVPTSLALEAILHWAHTTELSQDLDWTAFTD